MTDYLVVHIHHFLINAHCIKIKIILMKFNYYCRIDNYAGKINSTSHRIDKSRNYKLVWCAGLLACLQAIISLDNGET